VYPIILASTSPYRAQALKRISLSFTQEGSAVDEERWKSSTLSPENIAKELAQAKAQSVARKHPAAVVIGSDQLVSFNGNILGKPGTTQGAIEQLSSMSGKTHELITAMCVQSPQGTHHFCDITRLTMRNLDSETITRYVKRDQPLDCAGAYKIEAGGIALFSHIQSDDHSAIVGLPLIGLISHLRDLGFTFP
jgi:septum formation protein